jgi:hypothetical protein
MCGFGIAAEHPDAGHDLERLKGGNGHDRQCAAGAGDRATGDGQAGR